MYGSREVTKLRHLNQCWKLTNLQESIARDHSLPLSDTS